jgi:hypothetical protein
MSASDGIYSARILEQGEGTSDVFVSYIRGKAMQQLAPIILGTKIQHAFMKLLE